MKHSIRTSLLKWLIVPLLLCNLIGAALTFWIAWAPTRTAWDQSLADTAWALIPRIKEIDARIVIDLPQQAEQVLRVDHADSVYFSVRDDTGHLLAGDGDLPNAARPGALDEPVVDDGRMRGEPVRIITLRTRLTTQYVQISVAETLHKRDRSLGIILVTLLAVESILIALASGVVWYAVSRAMAPLHAIQRDLDARKPLELAPVTGSETPIEVAPLLGALNDLMSRSQQGAGAQRDFLANMAHQLRTPLAGLNVHLDWLKARHGLGNDTGMQQATQPDSVPDPELVATLDLMSASIGRMVRQTNQLLALARAEPSQFDHARLEAVALDGLVADAVQHFVQQADRKQIDLGFELEPAVVQGNRYLLHDLLDNLIDNAIRYTQSGGTVTVRCGAGPQGVQLEVEDDGPGIDPLHRELIFDRFYRIAGQTTGSGLGLAIVREILLAHQATVSLQTGPQGRGTVFRVVFPAAAT